MKIGKMALQHRNDDNYRLCSKKPSSAENGVMNYWSVHDGLRCAYVVCVWEVVAEAGGKDTASPTRPTGTQTLSSAWGQVVRAEGSQHSALCKRNATIYVHRSRSHIPGTCSGGILVDPVHLHGPSLAYSTTPEANPCPKCSQMRRL